MDPLRRTLLRSTATLPLIGLLGTGLLTPKRVLAAPWLQKAFMAKSSPDAMKELGIGNAAEARDIVIQAPEISENGAKVEIEVSTILANARTLLVFADKNPFPLCASLDFAPNVVPYAKLQLKLAESTRLRAVIKTTDGKHHVAYRDVKVTLGGCGG